MVLVQRKMNSATKTRQCTLWYMLASVGCWTHTRLEVARDAVSTMNTATKVVMEVCCSLKM